MASTAVNWQKYLEHIGRTDIGLRRANNQDSYRVVMASSEASWVERGHLFVVADGMGAHAAGELASKLAVDTISHTYHKTRDKTPAQALKLSIEEANRVINHRGQANPDFQGMGTTCTSLLLLPTSAIVAHVGDSRVYRLRGKKLEQLSFDHSLVWELTAGGQIKDEAVANNIPKNIITRSLGPNPEVQVDLEGPFPVLPDDRFLLCSDGLSGQVQDEEIGILLGTLPAEEAAQALIDLANLRGGPDNITVIIAHALAPPAAGAVTAAASDSAKKPAMHPLVYGVAALSVLVAALLAVFHPLFGVIAAVVGVAATVLAHGYVARTRRVRIAGWPVWTRSLPQLRRNAQHHVCARVGPHLRTTAYGGR